MDALCFGVTRSGFGGFDSCCSSECATEPYFNWCSMLMYSCIPLHLLDYSWMLCASGLLEADSVDVTLVALPTELPSHTFIGALCSCTLVYCFFFSIIHGCFVLRVYSQR